MLDGRYDIALADVFLGRCHVDGPFVLLFVRLRGGDGWKQENDEKHCQDYALE